jgi:hypothetical protein
VARAARRGNKPACSYLQAIRLGQIENPVVALVPILEAGAHLILGRSGSQTKEGMGETVGNWTMLRQKVVALRLALTAHFGGLF